MSDDQEEKKDNTLAGKLLLAMPTIGDPRFNRAVIFMCAHDESGAMGLMVNHELIDVGFDKIIEQTGIEDEIRVDLSKINVMNGGPVENSRGLLLHTGDFHQKDTVNVSEKYGVSGTIDALRDVLTGNGPDKMIFALGHAGWTAGQLDQELQQNTWLVAEASEELLFDTPNDQKWEKALKSLGIEPAMLSMDMGRA
jgi:putative transcriptional regulator